MASGKRQPSKQKRSSQNRQQRQALQVRKEAASAPPVEPVAPRRAEPAKAPASSAPSGPAEPKTSLLGRLRGPGAANLPASATGAKPAAPDPRRPSVADAARSGRDKAVTRQATRQATSRTTAGRAPAKTAPAPRGSVRTARRAAANERLSLQPPGYRAALSGLLAAGAAVLLSCLQATPVNHAGDLYTTDRLVAQWAVPVLNAAGHVANATPKAVAATITTAQWAHGRDTERLIQALWPLSAAVVLPVVAAYLTFQAVRRRRSAKVVTRAMYATLLGAFITTSLFVFFLPAIIAVTVASYQVRKAENAAIQAGLADDDGYDDDDDVIDAVVVDD